MVEVKTKFYEFDQNNTGGSFDIDDARGLGPHVWIEAVDLEHACSRASSIGIYFDGVEAGRDCRHCGDRWYVPCDDSKTAPEVNEEYDFNWHHTVYVHNIDGSIERITKPVNYKG
jgi:hypothetical protein